MTGWRWTMERGAVLTAVVLAILLLGVFHSVVAGAVERGPTRLLSATAQSEAGTLRAD